MLHRLTPLGLFHLPCALGTEPPSAEAIDLNRRARLALFALHALVTVGACACALWFLGSGSTGVSFFFLIAFMISSLLFLAFGAHSLSQAGAPLPSAWVAPLASLCDAHPELDAYRRRVVAQGRFFCKEEFPMLAEAAAELALRPAFMRLYLVDHEVFGAASICLDPLAAPVSTTSYGVNSNAAPFRARVPHSVVLPDEPLEPFLNLNLPPGMGQKNIVDDHAAPSVHI